MWEKPQTGWARLNIDRAAIGNPGRVGCGGLIRNDRGEWMGVFSRSLGCSNRFIAKMQLNVVDIQLDANAIVQLLSNPFDANICAMPLPNDRRQLISQIAQARIGHCFREANSCADLLARIRTNQDRTFVLYHDPPMDLLQLLSSDKVGLYHNRTITEPPLPP